MAEEKTRKEAENTAEAPETKKVSDEQIADEKVQQEEAKSDKKKKGKKDKKEEKIEELEEQLHQIQDKHLRLQAEFDNFRRRTMKEKADLIKSGGESVLVSILPVVDDFERALAPRVALS